MAGPEELVIKLVILTVILVVVGLAGYYGFKAYKKKCPDGLFACLGIDDLFGPNPDPNPNPDPDPNPDPTPSGAGAGAGADDPKSGLYDKCINFFSQQSQIQKFYKPSEGKLGVSWFWLATLKSKECKDKVSYYKLTLISQIDQYKTEYYYRIKGKENQSIKIQGLNNLSRSSSSGSTLMIKVTITPFDKEHNIIAEPISNIEFTTGVSSNDSTVSGDYLNFDLEDGNWWSSNTRDPKDEPVEEPSGMEAVSNCKYTITGYGSCKPNVDLSSQLDGKHICSQNGTKEVLTKIDKPATGGGSCTLPSPEFCQIATNCVEPESIPGDSPIWKSLPACETSGWVAVAGQPTCRDKTCAETDAIGNATADELYGKKAKYIQPLTNLEFTTFFNANEDQINCNPQSSLYEHPCIMDKTVRPYCSTDCDIKLEPTLELTGTRKLDCSTGEVFQRAKYKLKQKALHGGKECPNLKALSFRRLNDNENWFGSYDIKPKTDGSVPGYYNDSDDTIKDYSYIMPALDTNKNPIMYPRESCSMAGAAPGSGGTTGYRFHSRCNCALDGNVSSSGWVNI